MQNLSCYTARSALQTRAFVRLKGIQELDMRWGAHATATDAAFEHLKVAFFEWIAMSECERCDIGPYPTVKNRRDVRRGG